MILIMNELKTIVGVLRKLTVVSQKLTIHFLSHSDSFSQKYNPEQHVDPLCQLTSFTQIKGFNCKSCD
jgi:hypothetical protein